MLDAVIRKTLRVPAVTGPGGDGSAVARQLDAALMSVGFKLSKDLLEHLSERDPAMVKGVAGRVLSAVRELVGDHVEHNVYFRGFPADVPDTVEFWVQCIADALLDPRSAATVAAQLSPGVVNLLDLPRYGRYGHTYEEMLAAHDEFLPSLKDRLTVLHLGNSLPDEVRALYLSFAGSTIPISEDDLLLLHEVAGCCLDGPQPEVIPMRENRAVINRVRLAEDRPLLVDTVTDLLRLACAMSDGDVTLQEPTRFRSFRRAERRRLLAALDEVVATSELKLSDVSRHREPWKRLGERLHPHEHQQWRSAGEVFAVARGDRRVTSQACCCATSTASSGPGPRPRWTRPCPWWRTSSARCPVA